MATDIIQELTAFKNELIKGKNEEANKVIESYRFCNFVLFPQEIIAILKGKKLITFYLHFSALIFLPCTRIIYVHLISDYTINSLGLNPFLYYFYNF